MGWLLLLVPHLGEPARLTIAMRDKVAAPESAPD
jgi:hypothetical protein